MATLITCGGYDFDFLTCQPSLPPPDVHVDQSAFDELPMEERLTIRERDLQQMKSALRIKESDLEDAQQELKFHAIKNEELMDVINAFRSSSSDRSHEIMRAKAEQNSELTVQVHSLRDLLTKSGEEIANLQKEVAQKNKEGGKHAALERTHQRLQVQLKGLVKTLDNVEIKNIDIPSEWINLQWLTGGFAAKKDDNEESDKTIQGITQKIIAMEADRQRLMKESTLYNQSDGDKEEKILALERQVRRMQHDQDELKETNKSLKQQLDVREGKIGALEELFQNINASRALEAANSPNRHESLLNLEDDEDDVESVDINSLAGEKDQGSAGLSFEEMFTNIWTNFTGTTTPTKEKPEASPTEDEDQEISSCFNDSYHTKQVEEELQVAAKAEHNELKELYKGLKLDYETAQFKLSDLSAKLEESTIKANSFETKAKMREALLKDIIQQYKELQMENAASKDHMAKLKQKVTVLLSLEKQRHAETKAREAAAAEAAAALAGKVVLQSPAVSEAPTFDMSEHTKMTSQDDNSQDEGPSETNDGIDKNFVMEENKRLESECDRLQHEFDTAVEKINDLQESLEESKEKIKKSQSLQADQARAIALLEGEKATLQDRVIEATAKIVGTQSVHSRAEEDLAMVKEKAEQAREKQMQREKDLWEVIEQYKKLADENQSDNQEKKDAEHLQLTEKLKVQRRDMVYEYCKLEKGKKIFKI